MEIDTKVRNYEDYELLNKVKSLPSYKNIPSDYWILGVQSQEDTFNHFDDKFYLYKGEEFIMVVTGTTNAGLTGLHNYERYSKDGVLVVKTNEWFYDLWQYGLHRGRMPALRQINPIKFYRDNNKDNKVDEVGVVQEGMRGINFHTVIYQQTISYIRKLIGGWSVGCQVVNNVGRYYRLLNLVKHQKSVSYCLIKEF